MPFCKIYIHFIWATKCRRPIISKELKPVLLKHMRENCRSKGIFLDSINCVSDHIHLLVSLGTEQTIAKTMMLIKGESSFWVNKQKLIKGHFEWQDDYIALSVNYNALDNIRAYIRNQEEHHRKKNFNEEYQLFIAEELKRSVAVEAEMPV
jgi:putative transposase